jgi:hypothetical protein
MDTKQQTDPVIMSVDRLKWTIIATMVLTALLIGVTSQAGVLHAFAFLDPYVSWNSNLFPAAMLVFAVSMTLWRRSLARKAQSK